MFLFPLTCAILPPSPWLAFGGLLMLGILACAWLLARAQQRTRAAAKEQSWPSLWARLQSENGSATMEFVLVVPILMFLVMTLLQVALLMVGFQYIQHAAFRAARAAIVQIPTDLGSEKPNQIQVGSDSGKWGLIQAGARYALVPICGELDGQSTQAGATLASGMQTYFNTYGTSAPNWVDRLLAARMAYAAAKTRVALLPASNGHGVDASDYVNLPAAAGAFECGPKDPLAIEVTHDMNLSVPYVRALFQDGTHTTRAGQGAYTTISARAMLTNEGIDRALSPAPFPRLAPGQTSP